MSRTTLVRHTCAYLLNNSHSLALFHHYPKLNTSFILIIIIYSCSYYPYSCSYYPYYLLSLLSTYYYYYNYYLIIIYYYLFIIIITTIIIIIILLLLLLLLL
jgi:hypothetical protein